MRTLLKLLLFTCAISFAPAQDKPISSTERDTQYAWFDQLGYAEVLKGQFVRVETWMENDGKKLDARVQYGFLVTKDPKNSSFLATTLWREETPTNSSTSEYHAVPIEGFAETILETRVPEQVSQDATPEQLIARDSYQLFVLSRACYAKGDKELADKLYARSHTVKPQYGEGYGPFFDYLKGQIGQVSESQVAGEINDPEMSWEQILAHIDTFEKQFAKTDAADDLVPLRAAVALTVEARKKHKTVTAEETAKLPLQDEISELIFQLPDQKAVQFSNPGEPDIFLDPRGEKSPASKLLRIGFPAVPQLISALTDGRASRASSGPMWGGQGPKTPSFTVNMVALKILEKMSGQNFQGPQRYGTSLNPVLLATVQTNVKTWWSQVKNKGEKEALIEQIKSATGWSVYTECQRLAQAYPQDAAGPIVAAIKDPKNFQYSSNLFEIFSGQKIPVAREFRWDEMLHGNSLDIRLSALRLNLEAEREATLYWLIKECKDTVGDQRTTANIHPRDVIETLAQSKRTEGIELLRPEAARMDEDQLYSLIESLDGVGRKNGEKPEPGYNEAFEKLMMPLLLKSGRWHGCGSWGDMDITNVRICDLAAFVLAQTMPEKYKYTPSASIPEKDRQRYAELNLYRKEHGEAPLGLPVTQKVTRAESCTVRVVTITGAADVAPLAARAALALKGQVLTADGIDSVIKAAANKWPKALHKLSLKATRDSYGSGVVLVVDFSTTAPVQNSWDFQERDLLGAEDIQNSAGGGSDISTPDHAKIAQLFGADAYTPFEISYSITHKG